MSQGAKFFCFTFPLRCAACRGGDKEERLESCQICLLPIFIVNQAYSKVLKMKQLLIPGRWLRLGS